MPGLSFLSKKSWHTSNISNQEKVWLAEQKAEAEALKTKELQDQIKAEREKEEFDKLANKKSVGDRGTNWMYEGSLAAKDDSYNAKAVAEEDAKNEAFLLGKAYVPDGAQQHSGDFVLASAGMSGALEKASTMGAAIGGVGNNSNSNVVDGMGMGMSTGATTYQIQDDTTKMTTTVATTTTANTYDDNISNNNEWNANFHLQHEDPMYAVHQQQNAQRKDIEKKKRLMERAGLEIQMQPPVIGDSRSNGGDGRKMSGMPPEVDSAAKRGDEEDDKSDRRRKKKNKKTKKHRSKHTKSKKQKYKRSSIKRKHHHRHNHRDRSSSYSHYSSESASSAYSSSSDSSRRRDDKHARRRLPPHHYDSDDERDNKRGRERRSSSRSRSNSRRQRSSYRPRGRNRNEGGGSRRGSYSRSRSRDDYTKKYSSRDDDNRREYRRLHDHHHREHYDDRQRPPSKERPPKSTNNNRNHDINTKKKKMDGYGLIGTHNNASASSSHHQQVTKNLGPNQKLLDAKRNELERERQSRLEQAGVGQRSRGGDDHSGRNGGGGYSSREDKEHALKEMERSARDRRVG